MSLLDERGDDHANQESFDIEPDDLGVFEAFRFRGSDFRVITHSSVPRSASQAVDYIEHIELLWGVRPEYIEGRIARELSSQEQWVSVTWRELDDSGQWHDFVPSIARSSG